MVRDRGVLGLEPLLHRSLTGLALLLMGSAACNGNGSGSGEASCDTEAGPEIDGDWAPEIEDWTDPGPAGNEILAAPCDSVTSDPDPPPTIVAHHCFTTAVHAVHMRTGELLLMHGEQDERVWQIGTAPDQMDWHPVPFEAELERAVGGAWVPGTELAELFCSGHAQLEDGSILFAGGNVTSSPTGGGLYDTFHFEPAGASSASDPDPQCPFGWDLADQNDQWTNMSPRMAYDRWYPTLTVLGDGRVLISGGTSRIADHSTVPATFQPVGEADEVDVLELYDPTTSPPSIVQLDNPEARFPGEGGVPQYPFVFLLPNGDILFAGAEAIDEDEQRNGYVLVPDYGNTSNWAFDDHEFNSTIPGGSAVMPTPGYIMKSGGLGAGLHAVSTTETLDLRGFASGDYDSAPGSFSQSQDMHHPRHFHNLVIVPDGRVLAVGGNRWNNGNPEDPGEHFRNPCVYEGPMRSCTSGCSMEDLDCADGCPSVCIDTSPQFYTGSDQCFAIEPDPAFLTCSQIRSVECTPGTQGDQDCDAVLAGAYCVEGADGGRCRRDCLVAGDDCGLIQNCAVESAAESGQCRFGNNACYAEYRAEAWDPTCGTWTELGAQQHERMYHSTALLLPDTRVISMGGGHRNRNAFVTLEEQPWGEYFALDYAEDPNAEAPSFSFGSGGIQIPGEERYLRWGNRGVDVRVDTATPVAVSRASLIRLGSTTHGFDQDQRRLEFRVTGQWPQYHVDPRADEFFSNTAPPGYYMLFLLSDAGEPSEGRYIRVGDELSGSYFCEPSPGFSATETSCSSEPLSGACAPESTTTTALSAPLVPAAEGMDSGFRAFVPAGVVRDPAALTNEETALIQVRCAEACAAYYAGRPGQAANCDSPGVFEAPVLVEEGRYGSVDLIHASVRHGEGLLWGEPALSCDLATECYSHFDELLQPSILARSTPAADAVGLGEEWRVSVAGELEANSPAAVSAANADISGTVGFSECSEGNGAGPCPFYLGSMDLVLDDPLTLELSCPGGNEIHTLDTLNIRLGQPAFGLAKKNAVMRAFPAGGIVLEADGIVDQSFFFTRRASQDKVQLVASNGWVSMLGKNYGATVDLTVPCGSGTAEVELTWDFSAIAWPGKPPSIGIDVPDQVSCPSTVNLAYTATDSDGDIASIRWWVDGALLDDGVTQMQFSTAHELTAVVRDQRGATDTATKSVSCL